MATATTSVLAATLPRNIVIKSKAYSDRGNAYFKADGGSVLVGEDDVFSTLVKIEVERSTTNDKYVNYDSVISTGTGSGVETATPLLLNPTSLKRTPQSPLVPCSRRLRLMATACST
ncbi:hypothetical protein AAHA92_19435 [Salvia divinorum]|uniref:Uncharacterized protein n=1 Tax=Salvia divinorum TaxID=28513 RepID=A0ABD1H5B6_SALDI